ncbi:MAG TPA: PQQ-binding-like beta-propeller repeat protein, partial [Acidimicrobiales bacterium]|nr:PQQ-binding-like beta-propeller repeat protein [Acidimicrobiales bacterium]
MFDGQLYTEPLESGGRVFVATENDTIYALAADNGSVLWSTHVGTPVPSSSLPCGNIGPTVGITGTPVVDESRGEIFAVADEWNSGIVSHHLVGLNIFSGAMGLNQVIDPAGSTPTAQLQRTGLNLSNGNVIFGLGGNYGDCGSYHGWIIAVPEAGGAQT